MMMLDEFTEAYVTCALWSSLDDDGNPLDDNFDERHISVETLHRMQQDCAEFLEANRNLITEPNLIGGRETPEAQAGHDFWLTRNGHGAGFWDGDWTEEAGELLTRASKKFGEFSLYIGDDGLIHGM